MQTPLYTIGHSAHVLTYFLELLRHHGITALGDVRSLPYSRRHPQFNREALRHALARHHIAYVFLGDTLGARPSDDSCYVDGTVHYPRLAATEAFRRGLARVQRGIQRERVALMCAERDPLACHRPILICRALRGPAVSMRHILADGSLESQEASEQRLLTCIAEELSDPGQARRTRLERAYEIQGQRIAYTQRPIVGR